MTTEEKPDQADILLETEFNDYVGDLLADMDGRIANLRYGSGGVDEFLRFLKQASHNLKGMGASFGQPAVSMVAQRMENYIFDLTEVDERNLSDLQIYSDKFQDLVTGLLRLEDAELAAFARTLPAKPGFNIEDVQITDVEVMLVMPATTTTHIVTRELQACGYRVVAVNSTFEAIEQIVLTRPDLVIVTAEMSPMSGIDLAIAIKAMPLTGDVPLALLTSLHEDSQRLKKVPDSVPVIRKGDAFGDDLARALATLKIT